MCCSQQTAVEAEYHAALFGAAAAEDGVVLKQDCKAVANTANKPYTQAVHGRATHGGIGENWRWLSERCHKHTQHGGRKHFEQKLK